METIGLTADELRVLIPDTIVAKVSELDHSTPDRSSDVYAWVEALFGHNGEVFGEALIDILSENNKRIAQQLSDILGDR